MMKKTIFIGACALFFASTAFGQDIPQSKVPSLVINNFQQAFPKASDVEWEMNGKLYKVEFETGWRGTDHGAWYDKTGKLVKHKEDISKGDLPKAVKTTISNEFDGYRASDVTKITEGNKVSYTLELRDLTKEWEVAIDSAGKVLHKMAD